ncbi:MAG: hypothetical protein ACOCSE_01445 [Chitinivibrionales bacterium]
MEVSYKRDIKGLNLVLMCFLLFSIHCKNPSSEEGEAQGETSTEGLYIYLTDVEREDGVTNEKEVLDTAEMIGDPVLEYTEVVSYDTTSHIIDMSITRKDFFKRVTTIGEENEGFLVTLDSDKLYIGWFCGTYSSIERNNVVIMFDTVHEQLDSNQIRLKPGYPSDTCFTEPDPRENSRLFERLSEDGKAK